MGVQEDKRQGRRQKTKEAVEWLGVHDRDKPKRKLTSIPDDPFKFCLCLNIKGLGHNGIGSQHQLCVPPLKLL